MKLKKKKWYKKFRRNRDKLSEGVMFHINEQIPSKLLESILRDTELILLEFAVNKHNIPDPCKTLMFFWIKK